MKGFANAIWSAALVMLLVVLLTTGARLVSSVAADSDDPPPTIDRDTMEQEGVVGGGTETSLVPSGWRQQAAAVCVTPSLSIPDNDPVGVTSDIVLSSQFIADLDVYVDVSHTWVGDLILTVEHVNPGVSVTVIDRPGRLDSGVGCSQDSIVATLDDEATNLVEDECELGTPTISGSFIPNNPLSAFDNRNTAGTWRLTISDNEGGDIGTLNEWCVVVSSSIAYAVDSDVTDHLWMIDLDTGAATDVGPVGYGSVEGMAFAPDGTLYGVDDVTEELITIDLDTAASTVVGSLDVSVNDVGLAFDVLGNLWMVDDGSQNLYSVNPGTGEATLIGALGHKVTGLAARGMALYGLGGDSTNNLLTINTATGAATSVGPLVNVTVADGGLSFDAHGTLWGMADGASTIFTIDPGTGTATVVTTVTGVNGIENLAIPLPPVAYGVDSDYTDHLWLIYLNSGAAVDVGAVGFGSVEGLAFDPDGTLFGVDDVTEELITINLATGVGTLVGPLGVSVNDVGLASDLAGDLWMVDDGSMNLYSVNPGTGEGTLVGALGQKVTGLAARGLALYGLGGDATNNLVTINTATGAATSVGPLVNVTVTDGGLSIDAYGTLWGISDTAPDTIFTINPGTGTAAVVATTTGVNGIENLAIPVVRHKLYLPVMMRNS